MFRGLRKDYRDYSSLITQVCNAIMTMAISARMPFVARKAGDSNLIPGMLKIPAMSATRPIIVVINLEKLFEFRPCEIDFSLLIFTSIKIATPTTSRRIASRKYFRSKAKKPSEIVPTKPRMLRIASAV